MHFKLKVFDRILDVCHFEYHEAVEKEIENGYSECIDRIANKFFRGFDLLKEQTKKLGKKLDKENGGKHSTLRKGG